MSNSKDKFIITNLGSKSGVFFDFSLANFLNTAIKKKRLTETVQNDQKKNGLKRSGWIEGCTGAISDMSSLAGVSGTVIEASTGYPGD